MSEFLQSTLVEQIGIGVLLGIFVLALILKALYWVYLWQLKEYRTDRMRDFLTSPSGGRTLWSAGNLIEFGFLLWYFSTAFLVRAPETIAVSVTVLFGVALFGNCLLYGRRRLVPVWTTKALALASVSIFGLLVGVAILLFTTVSEPLVMAVSLVVTPLVVSLVLLVLQPITAVQKQRTIRQAKEKIDRLRPTVIGITGSYGKSSTKEFLKTILAQRYRVLATPKNVNVDIGVAQTILDDLTEQHEIFIVEMGAYRPGEIDAICDLVSPIVGVLTAINEQHLALFGSLQAIQDTKSELIAALPSSGLAVINRDNQYCMEVVERTRAKKKFFSTADVAHTYATGIVVDPSRVSFELHIGAQKMPVSAALAGVQVVPSVLAAATVASHLGMTMPEIVAGIGRLEPVAGTMQLRNGRHHFFVIDDSYNSNPDGFLAALDYLAQFRDKRKVVITPGMQELGAESDMHHRNVGTRTGEVADMLVVTKRDSAKPLRDAAKQGGLQETQIFIEERPAKLIRDLLDELTSDDVVLVEGRVQRAIMQYLLGQQ